MRSLNSLRWIQRGVNRVRWYINTRIWGMDIHPTAIISGKAHLDKTYPVGIHVGAYTYITLGVRIFAHDMSRNLRADTRIGANCFVGSGAIILPGVSIGNGSIVAAGAIVTKSVPSGCIVGGNPARVIRDGIVVREYGVLER